MPGKVAPDIVGEDLHGAHFKLSDYRGKVVVLVFWASWCSPCMADVPHELELIKRFKDKPFVLIGVDDDDDKLVAQRAIAKRQIPWRSFWAGGNGQFSPIMNAWNVSTIPTVFVIDQKRVVRYSYVDGDELDAAVEKLVEESDIKDAAR